MKDVNSKEFKHFLKIEKETELLQKELNRTEKIAIEKRLLSLINDDVLMNLSDEDLEKVSNILDKIDY